jgi:hypothetical protein
LQTREASKQILDHGVSKTEELPNLQEMKIASAGKTPERGAGSGTREE